MRRYLIILACVLYFYMAVLTGKVFYAREVNDICAEDVKRLRAVIIAFIWPFYWVGRGPITWVYDVFDKGTDWAVPHTPGGVE